MAPFPDLTSVALTKPGASSAVSPTTLRTRRGVQLVWNERQIGNETYAEHGADGLQPKTRRAILVAGRGQCDSRASCLRFFQLGGGTRIVFDFPCIANIPKHMHMSEKNDDARAIKFLVFTARASCAERDRLARVEAQISHLQVHIDVLRRERAQLQKNLETIVYPILTIPDEVSSQIFLLCLPADGRVRPSPCSAPLSLAQICSHFRRICLSTQGLWHSLVINAGRFRSDSAMDSAVAELFRPWFTRAGFSSLRLTLQHATSLASSLLHFIVAFSPQLHILELDTPMAEFRRLLQMLGPLPMLRKLSLSHSPHSYDPLPHIPFRNPPELTELCIFGGICLRDSSLATMPGTRLERLEITRISCDEFRRILQEYPLLRHLHVPDLDGSRNMQVLPPTLGIETLGVGESSWILDILTLPNLRRLDISITDKSPPHHLAQFLARSSCTLQHLGIVRLEDHYHQTSVSEIFETLVACLQLLPALASL
ncbi:hypothetical protein C8R45DRAFT_528990, partial [Mycena sanguinolenta]